ncbi:hypothetical protein HPB51_024550 [Rhipicephalus microplus]|uniref:Ribosomal RNA-processing protein 14/surfeit locus protein 6 C-terminal domain-containing protein n=1 Tax=Rhipicephalus microplus TaxID=6941 RepID=A0A9J6DKD1_RHIMP|nr:hypothetical protein HPB51_024550 [Rhipicephalus microplus]
MRQQPVVSAEAARVSATTSIVFVVAPAVPIFVTTMTPQSKRSDPGDPQYRQDGVNRESQLNLCKLRHAQISKFRNTKLGVFRDRKEGSGVKKAHKMARLDPGLFQTVSQLLQASEPKTKKQRKAKASLHSAALDRASSLDELRQRLSHKIEALRGKRPVGGERKANKKDAKPAAKRTQNKQHKPNRDSLPAASNKKAVKAGPAAPVFNRDSHIVYSKFELADSSTGMDAHPKVEKKKLVRQLEVKAEKMKDLEERDPERAKQAQEKQKWHRALDRAEGIKVGE